MKYFQADNSEQYFFAFTELSCFKDHTLFLEDLATFDGCKFTRFSPNVKLLFVIWATFSFEILLTSTTSTASTILLSLPSEIGNDPLRRFNVGDEPGDALGETDGTRSLGLNRLV